VADTADVCSIANEFGVSEHVNVVVNESLEPASSYCCSHAALAAAHDDATGVAALGVFQREMRRTIWNSCCNETQMMFVCPRRAGDGLPNAAANAAALAAPTEIWVCVTAKLFDRMWCKVQELVVALGAALHHRVCVFSLEETELVKRLPDLGSRRVRFGDDTCIFSDLAPLPCTAVLAMPSSGGAGAFPVTVALHNASLAPAVAIVPHRFRSSSAGAYVQIGGGSQKGSVPEVFVGTCGQPWCGHPFRLDSVGEVVLNDTRMDPADSSNDIRLTPVAVSFPGLSSVEPGMFGDVVINSRAMPGSDPEGAMQPLKAGNVFSSVVDFGLYSIGSSKGDPPCTASNMEPQPCLSHALPVRLPGMPVHTMTPVRCLPDSRVYMGACHYHGINTPGDSSNTLDVIGYAEKVLSVRSAGFPGVDMAVEITYVALHIGGAEPTVTLAATSCLMRRSVHLEASPHCIPLSVPGHGSASVALREAWPLSQKLRVNILLVRREPMAWPLRWCQRGQEALPYHDSVVKEGLAGWLASGVPAYPAVAAAASASLASIFGSTFYTLTPAHLALGFVEQLQADPDNSLPPGPVTYVHPLRGRAPPQPSCLIATTLSAASRGTAACNFS
jgi:hypothetical protein